MKKTRIALLGLAVAAAGFLSFNSPATSTLKGKVTPGFYAVHAWAISEHDTLYTTIDDGNFVFPISEPGTYKIVIEARSPYRHMEKTGILIKEGQAMDIGALSLHKWE